MLEQLNNQYTFKVIDKRTGIEINRNWLLEKYGSSASQMIGFALDEDGYLFLIDRYNNIFYLDAEDNIYFEVIFKCKEEQNEAK